LSERSLVLIKPDGVKRGLVGEVLKRIETKGWKIVALEMKKLDEKNCCCSLCRARGQTIF